MCSQYILAALPPDERKSMKAPADPGPAFPALTCHQTWTGRSTDGGILLFLGAGFSWERLRAGGLANGTDSLIVCVFNESLSSWSAVGNGSCSNRKAAQPWGGAATMLLWSTAGPTGSAEGSGVTPYSSQRNWYPEEGVVSNWVMKVSEGKETEGPNVDGEERKTSEIKGWGKTKRQVFAVNRAITLILPQVRRKQPSGEGPREVRKSQAQDVLIFLTKGSWYSEVALSYQEARLTILCRIPTCCIGLFLWVEFDWILHQNCI